MRTVSDNEMVATAASDLHGGYVRGYVLGTKLDDFRKNGLLPGSAPTSPQQRNHPGDIKPEPEAQPNALGAAAQAGRPVLQNIAPTADKLKTMLEWAALMYQVYKWSATVNVLTAPLLGAVGAPLLASVAVIIAGVVIGAGIYAIASLYTAPRVVAQQPGRRSGRR